MEDFHTPSLRTAPNSTIIPFPCQKESALGLYHVDWRLMKRPRWVANLNPTFLNLENVVISTRKVVLKKFKKNFIHIKEEKFRYFAQARKVLEAELFALFDFLEDSDFIVKRNLVDKFNQQVVLGKIITVSQMLLFYKKAQQLAECIQTYLEKNEYCENFMQEISLEVFEKGFEAEKNDNKLKNFCPNCFSEEEL